MSRVTITDTEVRRMFAITRSYEQDDPAEPLPTELLHDLRQLVTCDVVCASGQDTPRWEFFADQTFPYFEVPAAEIADLERAYYEHYWSSSCSYPDRTGDLSAIARQDDLVPDGVPYRASRMYVDYSRPLGVEHEIMVCLWAGAPQRTLRLLFCRGTGSDFSDRDVEVLTLLRPHLEAAYATAERHRQGGAVLTARQQEILQCVESGNTNRQIARRLHVSEATVGKHLENIYQRLDVNSRTAAVARSRALV